MTAGAIGSRASRYCDSIREVVRAPGLPLPEMTRKRSIISGRDSIDSKAPQKPVPTKIFSQFDFDSCIPRDPRKSAASHCIACIDHPASGHEFSVNGIFTLLHMNPA
ncbi:hypothetical protein [Tsuneonella suprasediminis]|uniref:hypothetical protein n=1 Tax=Tsuneonella suprasediminis TaxID=2306996 RepID=UPI001058CFED|nr:hypothetical protein [Tsuneonella suprasediminis]